MISIQTNDITEKQLAEIALAIQVRWDVPTFVKMHEIVVVEDDIEPPSRKLRPDEFQNGLSVIFNNLSMQNSFKIIQSGRTKFTIERVEGTDLPEWMADIERPSRVPHGVFECPHCGKWFQSDIELSLHQKLHYII